MIAAKSIEQENGKVRRAILKVQYEIKNTSVLYILATLFFIPSS